MLKLPVRNNKLKILVAPLDWGLGHTTRCIPVIYELLALGVEVVLAGNKVQRSLLQKEFPDCRFLKLEGYNITYSNRGKGFVWKILRQAPQIAGAVSKERQWLLALIKKEKIDGVISDNRFGLYCKKIPTVFITHQLRIKTGIGRGTESLLQKFNYNYINRFSKCWIPDYVGHPNLAGELAHPEKLPKTICEYIGPLSRMNSLPEKRIACHLLIMLSGPEPQRTLFEKMIFEQLPDLNGAATVVRGLPAETAKLSSTNGVTIYNHLPKDELNKEMCRAEYVICRSGYSSVMDIHAAGAKSILAPTPGQTEQEYLAEYLASQNFCITASQQNFNLKSLLKEARNFNFQNSFGQNRNSLRQAVQKFIEECAGYKTKPGL